MQLMLVRTMRTYTDSRILIIVADGFTPIMRAIQFEGVHDTMRVVRYLYDLGAGMYFNTLIMSSLIKF